jgi:uncharacterized membrane protein
VKDLNVEQVWYGLWLIKAIVSIFLFWVVALFCKRLMRRIPWDRDKSVSHRKHLVR